MEFELKLSAVIVAVFVVLMILEARFSGRDYPQRRGWRLKGWLFFVSSGLLAGAVRLFVPLGNWLGTGYLIDAGSLGPVVGGVFGYFAYSFFAYWWHRATHLNGVLWRFVHQLHHAPVRVDVAGTAVVHPFEYIVIALLLNFVTVVLLNLSFDAALVTIFIAQMYAFFGHLNIKTPRIFGYFVQRPEGHVLHHHRRITLVNFGDFPLWDILFGTFQNPREFSQEPVGFGGRFDEAYGAMLLCRDVSGEEQAQDLTAEDAQPLTPPAILSGERPGPHGLHGGLSWSLKAGDAAQQIDEHAHGRGHS